MSINNKEGLSAELQKPFELQDIEWRVQQAGISKNGKPFVMVMPYITNRAVQKRLDDVLGVMGWEDQYKETTDGSGFLCGITIHFNDKSVTKWDGAEKTNVASLKGGLSDSEKRAAVKFGIGRYLYQLDVQFADCMVVKSRYDANNYYFDKKTSTHISWDNPRLPKWAIPFEDYSEFIIPINNANDMAELKEAFTQAWNAATTAQSEDLKSQAVKAKDGRKAYINTNIKKIMAKKIAEFDEWLEVEVRMFNELPTKSTVENFRNKIKESMEVKLKGQHFDPAPLFDKLSAKCEQRVNEIESKENK